MRASSVTSVVSDLILCDPVDCSLPGSFVHGDSAGNAGVGCHAPLQGIFSTQRSNPHLLCLLHCRRILYLLSHQGSPTLCTFYHNWKESSRSHTLDIVGIVQVWLPNLTTWVLRRVTRGSPFLEAGQTQACVTPGSVYTC